MIAATAGYSLVPLVIATAGGSESPFLLNGGLTLGLWIGYVPFVWHGYADLLRDQTVRRAIRSRLWSWPILFMVVNNFEFAFFAWSAKHIDIAATAILFETWPVLLIALTLWLYRNEQRYRRSSFSMWLLVAVGFAGFVFVVLSESATTGASGNADIGSVTAGVTLAVIASAVTSLSAFGFKWGTDLAAAVGPRPKAGGWSVELFGAIVASLAANTVVIPANLAAGYALGEQMSGGTFAIAVGAGVVCHAGATLCWRNANLITRNLGINAIGYATPVLSLGWLWLFSQAEVARVDYLVIGMAGIVTANLLINFEAEIQMGFKALLISLWACGSFVTLRDEALEAVAGQGWLWPGDTYLGSLALAATVFTLMLSFRIARLVTRSQREDNTMFALFQNVDALAERGVMESGAQERILEIDGAHAADELKRAYEEAKACFDQAREDGPSDEDRHRLGEAEAQLNSVVHSQRHGIEVGELFALIVFAAITVVLGLLGRPANVNGWTGFLFEGFIAAFCGVVIFLMVNVWDVHRDRATEILERRGERRYGVALRDAENRRFEQMTSVAIGLAIVASYTSLLWHKWLN